MNRVAIFGYGSSGRRHLATVRASTPSTEILVCSSQNLTGKPFDSTSLLSDVSDFKPDLAIICGAPSTRLDAIEALPAHTRGILIEKPFALDHQQGVALGAEIEKRGCFAQVGYNLRFSPSLAVFRSRIQAGHLGDVLSVRAETGQHLASWRPEQDYRTTVSAQDALGGGVLRELSHELDYLMWIFGDVTWVSAWHGRQSSMEINVDDTAHITLSFAGSDQVPPTIGQLNLDFVRHDSTRRVSAICESGTLRWDGVSGRVEQWQEGGSGWDLLYAEAPEAASTYSLQWDSFLSATQSGSGLGATVNDGLKVLALIDLIRASNTTGGHRFSPDREELPG